MKLHDDGWENSSFASDDVYVLGYGCGVSQYPQYYHIDLYKYQILPHPYWGSFGGYPGETFIK